MNTTPEHPIMHHARLAATTAVLFVCSLAQGAGEHTVLLDDAEMRRFSSGLNAAAGLKVGVQMQLRYDINLREDDSLGDDDTTIGFQMRRLKVEAKGDITESISGKVAFGFNRGGGDAALDDALVDWEINDSASLRIGQFKLPFMREELVSSKRQLSVERSSMNETFNQDRSQGVQLTFGGDAFRAAFAFSDGFGSEDTAFDSAGEADYAITGRAEMKFGDAGWKAFDQFSSFRGAPRGGLIGVAGHFERTGDTNPTPAEGEIASFTIDGSYVADGWNLFGAFVWRNTDAGATGFDDTGAVLQGGVFVSDQAELFARWSAVFADSGRGATGDDYSDITAGLNYYLVPESHAAKFTVGVTYSLDATTTSIVPTSTGHNLFADAEDGQIAITSQVQFLF